jgi:hypothetical protein
VVEPRKTVESGCGVEPRVARGQGPLAMTMEDSIANMKVLDALFVSESKGGWVEV